MKIDVLDKLTNERSQHIYRVTEIVKKIENSVYQTGSFNVKIIYEDKDQKVQVLLCNDIDGQERPMKLHGHSVHEYFVCIQGELVICKDNKHITLSANDYYHISPRVAHSTYPKKDCIVLAIFVPSELNFDELNTDLLPLG